VEPRREHVEQADHTRGVGARLLGAVAVLVAQVPRDGRREAARAVETRMDPLQPAHPAEAFLAADLVAEPEGLSARSGVGGQQRRLRGEALGEQQDLVPTAARRLVVEHRDRSTALAGPPGHLVAPLVEPDGGPRQALQVEDPLGRLAPRAGDPGDDDHPQAGPGAGRLEVHVIDGHGALLSQSRSLAPALGPARADRRPSA
jgi:hypothetical protein